MDQSTALGGNSPLSGKSNPLSGNAQSATQAAHQAVDDVADKAAAQKSMTPSILLGTWHNCAIPRRYASWQPTAPCSARG